MGKGAGKGEGKGGCGFLEVQLLEALCSVVRMRCQMINCCTFVFDKIRVVTFGSLHFASVFSLHAAALVKNICPRAMSMRRCKHAL
jgi:hypothetical protein